MTETDLVLRGASGLRRRRLTDKAATALVSLAFVVALVPLVLVVSFTVSRGLRRLDTGFLTHSMRGVGPRDAGGGLYHSLIATLEQVGIATVLAVPLGLLTAVYVVEYGRGKRLAGVVSTAVDVMTGVPSIVAGLFVYAFWVLALGQGFSGLAAGLALAILMLPTVIRSAEEMLRLVPQALREAALGLGIPRWRTILSVVLPTASAGIITGVMLAISRVIGETAPLILTALGFNAINANPLQGQQSGLGLFVFSEAQRPLQAALDRAWAGALVLITLVMVLNLVARLIASRTQVR